MIPIQDELLTLFEQMDEQQKNKLLHVARQLVRIPTPQLHRYTARELMALPVEERERRVAEAIAQAANEDFEVFEAYTEEDLDDN